MAMETVESVYTTQFSDTWHELAQQKMSRLMPFAIFKTISADDFAYDRYDSVEMRLVNERHAKADFDNLEMSRRQIPRDRYIVNLPIDQRDERALLVDPESPLAEAAVNAAMRQFDRIIYGAMFADVKTGRNFTTTVTAAADGVKTVNATAGWTYEKSEEILQNFYDEEVGLEGPENIILGMTGKEHTAQLSELELTSGDFTRQGSVDKGLVANILGMRTILFGASVKTPLMTVTGGTRDCFAVSSRGICLGVSKNMTIKVEPRSDLVETRQLQIIIEAGAVRTEGVRVQKVQTTA